MINFGNDETGEQDYKKGMKKFSISETTSAGKNVIHAAGAFWPAAEMPPSGHKADNSRFEIKK